MNKLDKVIKVTVAIVTFWLLYSFIVRNQLVVEFMRPQVDSGRLGFATANLLTGLFEILVAIGGVIILSFTRVLEFGSAFVNAQLSRIQNGDSIGDADSIESQDPKRLTADLSRLLIQAVVEGNRPLTIQLAHRLAKKSFLDASGEDQT